MPRPTKSWDRLAGKVALVTGAGSETIGIGKAIALLMAAEGAKVCVLDLDAARAGITVDEIVAAGGEAVALVADVGDPAACKRAVDEAVAAFGGLDVLVNNVGIHSPTPLVPFDAPAWDRVSAVNLTSAAAMSGAAIPHMAARGGGAILMIASVAGMLAHGTSAYATSKAGMIALSRDLAAMHGRQGIRCNTIAPGHLFTSHMEHELTDEMRRVRRNVAPLGIEGDSWDVARAAVFLASEEARFITGVLLPVDGGVTAIGPLLGVGLAAQD